MNVRYIPNDSSCEKINKTTWKIFAKKEIKISPNALKVINLCFGVEIANGMIFIALSNNLKESCIIHNEIVLESTENISITIFNNSSETITIKPNQSICLLKYFA